MLCVRILSCVFGLLTSILLCHSSPLLEFQNVAGALKDRIIYLDKQRTDVTLDATASDHRIVYFAGPYDAQYQKLTFECRVNQQDTQLSAISLCCREGADVPKGTCNSLPFSRKNDAILCLNTKIKYELDGMSGVTFIVDRTPSDFPIAGFISCTLTNSAKTSIASNEIELRDVLFYRQKLKANIIPGGVVKVPAITEFPFRFECLDDELSKHDWPNWMHLFTGSLGPFEWRRCMTRNQNRNQFTCSENSVIIPSTEFVSYFNGTMYLLSPELIKGGDYALLCRSSGNTEPIKAFVSETKQTTDSIILEGLIVDPDSGIKLTTFERLSADSLTYNVIDGNILNRFSLDALYREPDGGSAFVWYKDSQPIALKTVTKYSYPFPAKVTLGMNGTYTLHVTSEKYPSNQLTFTYHVFVIQPSSFTDPTCVYGTFYVLEKGNYTTSCAFNAMNEAELHVGVNEFESASAERLREMLKKGIYVNRPLSALAINFNETKAANMKAGRSVHISIVDVQPLQDFVLTVRISSKYGDSHLSSSLRIVPLPKLRYSPSDQNCVDRCDIAPYNVSCAIDTKLLEIWYSQFGITSSVDWIIQNSWTSKKLEMYGLDRYFTVHPSPGESLITVWPSGAPEAPMANGSATQTGNYPLTLREFLTRELSGPESIAPKEFFLRCWIRLYVTLPQARFVPAQSHHQNEWLSRSARRSINLNSNTDRGRIIYDSDVNFYPQLGGMLTVHRLFTPNEAPTMANIAWIAAIVLGIVTITIVILLSVWLFTRDRGETYPLQKRELAHGYNPDEELKQKVFQTYQRQDEPPIANSRFSLNDEGVNFESEDDGELEQYDDFNEEGSFINEYKNDPPFVRSNHQIDITGGVTPGPPPRPGFNQTPV